MKMIRQFASILLVVVLLTSGTCFAAGSSITYYDHGRTQNGEMAWVILAWVGDDATGAIPTKTTDEITLPGGGQTVTNFIQGYFLCDVEVDPGSTAPTADYDIAISTSGGANITNGSLDDLSATVTQIRRMKGYSGTSTWIGCHYVTGPLTIVFSNTTVNSSTGTVKLIFSKP